MLKLSQAERGKQYKVQNLSSLKALSKRLAVLGLNTGVMIELTALYKHGAVIRTPFGNIALGSDLLDSIFVTLV